MDAGPLTDPSKDPMAVELGRRGGLKGGRARAEKLTADERTEISKRAAEARWAPRNGVLVPAAVGRPEQNDAQAMLAASTASLHRAFEGERFGTILADPPWRFINRTGKVAPEHRRLARYATMTAREIAALPIRDFAAGRSHCYLWTPNALVLDALSVLEAWGFTYICA